MVIIHAGFVHNRFQTGHDGKTPHSRIRGKPFEKSLCEFGECVHYKVPKRLIGPDLNKWDERWSEGIFLGVRTISNEIYVGTPSGVIKCRTIRRRVPESRFDVNTLNTFRGVPWDLQPADSEQELPAEVQLQPLPAADHVPDQEIQDDAVIPREFKIFRDM